MEILQLENIGFSYVGNERRVLNELSLTVNDGDFVLLLGDTGCGKSTLLKLIKREISPKGAFSGSIIYNGEHLENSDKSPWVAYVSQHINEQVVKDTVFAELRFGLENMGLDDETIRKRVAETALFFGIDDIMDRRTDELSGGMLQTVELAAITAMRPDILLLDEPTSQLDPIAANNFFMLLRRLNREIGMTIIVAEHRNDELYSVVDKIAIMNDGKIAAIGSAQDIAKFAENNGMVHLLPSFVGAFVKNGIYDVTDIRSARANLPNKSDYLQPPKINITIDSGTAVELKNICYKYDKSSPDLFDGLNLSINSGEIFGLLGANASGKTTLIKLVCGIFKPYVGKVKIYGKNISKYSKDELYGNIISFMPQTPSDIFLFDDVKKECDGADNFDGFAIDFTKYYGKNPLDLSGGEQQLLALYKCVKKQPSVLVLDEPTKGVDRICKEHIKNMLIKLKNDGVTIIIVTHDVEFAAEVCDRCTLLFDKRRTSPQNAAEFFADNSYFTTHAVRIAGKMNRQIVTNDDLMGYISGGKNE